MGIVVLLLKQVWRHFGPASVLFLSGGCLPHRTRKRRPKVWTYRASGEVDMVMEFASTFQLIRPAPDRINT